MMDRRVFEVLAVEVVRGLRGQGFNAMRFADQKFSLGEGKGAAYWFLVGSWSERLSAACFTSSAMDPWRVSSSDLPYRSGALPAVFEMYWNSPECWTERRRQEGGSA
ncbi:unnamed protein product [Sphagnum troendelagicum]